MTRLTYAQALDEAIALEMRADPAVFCLGTAPPPGLLDEFGPERVRTTPISEPAMTGMAIGAAAGGKRPVVLWRNITFAFNSFDQVVNQAAKMRYMSGGQTSLPVVFRAGCGSGNSMAAQHSQSPYSIYAHVPGLKVILPADPLTAVGLLRSAIRDDNPVVCFEPTRCNALEDRIPADHLVALGSAEVKRPGSDVTVVGLGFMVQVALQVAEALAGEGISVEVVDPRTLSPLDAATIRESVARTGRLVVADEAPAMCSMAAEIAAAVCEDADTFAALRAPCARVCGLPVPIPFSRPLEDFVLPGTARLADEIRRIVEAPPREGARAHGLMAAGS
jgi:pyruvate dehydrogenase E1 component beta subunit